MRKKLAKGYKCSDGKPLFGKGRITDKAINILQSYYGMSIRQNIGNLYQMKVLVQFYTTVLTLRTWR